MITDYSDALIVQEVSPRDGLQIEPTWVETADKITPFFLFCFDH